MEATRTRQPSPSDVSAEEWALVVPYLTLMTSEAPQRQYVLREVFNALRWIVRTGAAWRYLPHDFPPWEAVYQQTQRWFKAGCFETLVADLRTLIRHAHGREPDPTASIFDTRTLQGTPESGQRAGYDGHTKRKGSKVHVAVDTLGEFLALVVTPANAQERAQVGELAAAVQAATGETVEVSFVDQGYTGETAEQAANECGIHLVVVKLEEAKQGFVLLPRRWLVERSFAWLSRFRRLAKDYERLTATLAGLHLVAFTVLMLHRLFHLLGQSP